MSRSTRSSASPQRPLAIALVSPLIAGSLFSSLAADPPAQTSPPVREGDRIRFGLVVVNPSNRTVSFPATVNMTNGVLEYAVVTDYGKTHESLLITSALPMDVQAGLLLLGARPSGTNRVQATAPMVPLEAAIRPTVLWSSQGQTSSYPLGRLIGLTRGGATGAITGSLPAGPWLFNGSQVTAEGFGAHFEGSIIALIHDPIAILNNPGPDRDDDDIHVPAVLPLPPIGTEVTVELNLEPSKRDGTPAGNPPLHPNVPPSPPHAPRFP